MVSHRPGVRGHRFYGSPAWAHAHGPHRGDALLRRSTTRSIVMRFRVRPLNETTWPDFERLVERHNGVWGGCWCMAFHSEGVGRTRTVAQNRSEKERRVREGQAHAALMYEFYVGVLVMEKRLDVPTPGGVRWIVVGHRERLGPPWLWSRPTTRSGRRRDGHPAYRFCLRRRPCRAPIPGSRGGRGAALTRGPRDVCHRRPGPRRPGTHRSRWPIGLTCETMETL